MLIINSPLYENPENNYDEVLPPIGLGYLCTALKKAGLDVELLDALAGKMTLSDIVDYIEYGKFNHIGINIFSTNHELVKKIICNVERDVYFILGGAFIKTNYQEILKWEINKKLSLVIGEGDYIISDIIGGNVKEKPFIEKNDKRVYRVDSKSCYFPKDISGLEIDRNFFSYEPTTSAKSNKLEGNIIVSRGCIYDCAFCSAAISLNLGNKARIKDNESVMKEISQIISLYPEIKSIRVLDDLFLRNIQSIKNVIEIFSNFDVEWRAMCHIKSLRSIDNALLVKMKNSGCSELSIGIESGNNEILKLIKKNNTIDEIKVTIERIYKAGISVKGYFILGFPGEDEKQFNNIYELAKYLKEKSFVYGEKFRISVFQFRPYHGTQLYYDLIKKGYKEPGKIVPKSIGGEKKIGEYDFGSENFSKESNYILDKYIEKIRTLNDYTKIFIPYINTKINIPKNNGVFFVGLSHKKGKDNEVLNAFCSSTPSGKIIDRVLESAKNVKNIENQDIYKTNLVKGVPLGENGKIRYPNKEEKILGFNTLVKEIETYKPKSVLLFGNQVVDFVVKELNLEKIRVSPKGNISYTLFKNKKFCNTIFIGLQHPSYIAVYKRKNIEEYIENIIELVDRKFL